jgi:hypothetical protein
VRLGTLRATLRPVGHARPQSSWVNLLVLDDANSHPSAIAVRPLRGYSDDHSVGNEALIAVWYALSVAAAVLSQLNVAACAAALVPILIISS